MKEGQPATQSRCIIRLHCPKPRAFRIGCNFSAVDAPFVNFDDAPGRLA